jgi:hypothetical protein
LRRICTRWSSSSLVRGLGVNLGWDEAWRFLGWYVNFEEPPRITPGRIDTMDLVLDAMVALESVAARLRRRRMTSPTCTCCAPQNPRNAARSG